MNAQQNQQCEPSTASDAVANAILVHELAGGVVHSFLPAAEAHKRLDEALSQRSAGSVFVVEDGIGAEIYYSVSPDLRSRIEDAKQRLRRGLHWQRVMDNHGVPVDRELRAKVANAMREILEASIGSCNPSAKTH